MNRSYGAIIMTTVVIFAAPHLLNTYVISYTIRMNG